MRGQLYGIHIADIHFGASTPSEQYSILKNQFIDFIDVLPRIDVISVDGDLFDKKMMANSEGIYYASLLVSDIVNVAMKHNSTVVLLSGTFTHDADQLKLFEHYLYDTNVDFRIITTICFETIKNARVLCIPELYNVSEKTYDEYLHHSGYYDEVFMHGTFKGAVYGDNSGAAKLFNPHDFDMLLGFAIMGHVHKAQCLNGYYYYCGNPYTWKFGEEYDKGFMITVHDLDLMQHYVHFQKILCPKYITLEINDIVKDPAYIIKYIDKLQKEKDIDYLKIKFTTPINESDKLIISSHYRNIPTTFVEFLSIIEEHKIEQMRENNIPVQYDFLIDDSIPAIEKFVKFVNIQEGSDFITVDRLKKILSQ